MKRKLLLLFFICIVTLALSICVSGAQLNLRVELDDGTVVSPIDDTVYLPSYADITSLKISFLTGFKNITLNGVAVKSGDEINISSLKKVNQTDRVEYYELNFRAEDANNPEYNIKLYKANNLNSLHITTSIGRDQLTNDVKDEGASVRLVNKNAQVIFQKQATVKTRGNSTDTYLKKPFQVKFDKGFDVMGMGKAKTWLLLADYLDQSYMRNALMYKLAKDLGMGACDYTSVDVFIDGAYQGVYLLCEKVNINANRVNIAELEKQNDALNQQYSTKTTTITDNSAPLISETAITEYKYVNDIVNPTDITGGYLVELDNNNKDNRSKFDSYFMVKTSFGENLYVIQSPEKCSKEQVEYIARLFAEMEEAMASADGKNSQGKHYTEYIDMDSFAVAYIMAELGRNYDAGSASIYFNKDIDKNGEVSKIVKGPLWDCDNTLGNIHRNNAEDQKSMWAKNRTPWNMLTNHDDFNESVKKHFEKAYDLIYDMLDKDGFIDKQIETLGYSAIMDRERWNQADSNAWPRYEDGSLHWFQSNGDAFPTYAVYTDYVNSTQFTAVGYLACMLKTRCDYLVSTWGCDVEPRTRTLNTKPSPLDETVDMTPILPNQPPVQTNPGQGTEQPPDTNLVPEPQVDNDGFSTEAIITLVVIGAIAAISIVLPIILKKKKANKAPQSHSKEQTTPQQEPTSPTEEQPAPSSTEAPEDKGEN